MEQEKQSGTLKNTVKIKNSGPCKKKITIEIPRQKINDAMDKKYEQLRKEAAIPGFRKGRAPRRLLEKRFGKETVEQIKLQLLAEASETALKDNDIDALREPDLDYENIEMPEEGAFKFDFEVEVRPEFKLPELEGIAVTRSSLEVTDKQIDSEIERLQKYSGLWIPREDGEVTLEDQIIADVVLKIETVEEEQKFDNIEIFVRDNGFVAGIPVEKLDKLLAGAKAGETRKTTVKVEKTYFKEEYRGKKIDIQITIKEIKWLKPAELNEDFLKRFGAEDAKELRERISDNLHDRLEQQSRGEMAEQIYKYMLDKVKFDLPTDIVADQAQTILRRQTASLMQRGLAGEQLKEEMQKLQAASEEQAKQQLKTFFIIDKVADKLGIEVTEEEINGRIARLAIQQGQRPERIREQMLRNGTLAQFRSQVREEKCIAKILDSAKITETGGGKKIKKAVKKTVKKPVRKMAKKADSTTKKPVKKKTNK